jgi:hypothetical protein
MACLISRLSIMQKGSRYVPFFESPAVGLCEGGNSNNKDANKWVKSLLRKGWDIKL